MLDPQTTQLANLLATRARIFKIFQDNKYLVVEFTKKNGEYRSMTCTLHPEVLPAYIFESIKGGRAEPTASFAVWDLNKKAWRAFLIDNVNMITSQNKETGEETVQYLKD